MLDRLFITVTAALAWVVMPLAASADDARTYHEPWLGADRLDWCFAWGSGCGEQAATAFCQRQGYSTSIEFAIDHDMGLSQPTRVLSTGAVCDQAFCDGFSFIRCK